MTRNTNVNNIKAVYQLATAEEIATGKVWYQTAYSAALIIAERHNVSTVVAIGVIAALSPRNRWSRNLIDAENLIEAYVADPESASELKVCTFGANKAKALRILESGNPAVELILDILSGPKLREFARCIINSLSGPKLREFATCIYDIQTDEVCVDGHAYCIWNGGRTSLADVAYIGVKLRAQIKEDYRDAASDLGLTPSALQAITWVAWRRLHGITN